MRIPPRLLRKVRDFLSSGLLRADAVRLAREFDRYVAPLRKKSTSVRKLFPAPRMTRAQVRAACMDRAAGFCECGCGIAFGVGEFTPEMDHFYGRFYETVDGCWMLLRGHHRQKTENAPTREVWDGRFKAFCKRHGYVFVGRLTKNLPRMGRRA